MAITQINDYAEGDVNLTSLMETLDNAYIGKAEISISNYSGTGASVVEIGSRFENNGTLFEVETADETPTGYAGISVSTTFYLYYDASGGVFIYAETVPTWSDALQGWYNGNDRAFFSMYKDSGGTLYENKAKMLSDSRNTEIKIDTISEKTEGAGVSVQAVSGEQVFRKIVEIGDWDMTSATLTTVNHGLTDFKKIRDVAVIIRNDPDNIYFNLGTFGTTAGVSSGYVGSYQATTIGIGRTTGGAFDNSDFNATSYNRGWVYITYVE
jgi:hypothetical protein